MQFLKNKTHYTAKTSEHLLRDPEKKDDVTSVREEVSNGLPSKLFVNSKARFITFMLSP